MYFLPFLVVSLVHGHGGLGAGHFMAYGGYLCILEIPQQLDKHGTICNVGCAGGLISGNTGETEIQVFSLGFRRGKNGLLSTARGYHVLFSWSPGFLRDRALFCRV